MEMQRTVVGIAVESSRPGEGEEYGSGTIISVCDDGSVWQMDTFSEFRPKWCWDELPPVPGTQRDQELAKEQG